MPSVFIFFRCRQVDMEIDLVGSVDAPSRKVSGVPRWLTLTAHRDGWRVGLNMTSVVDV